MRKENWSVWFEFVFFKQHRKRWASETFFSVFTCEQAVEAKPWHMLSEHSAAGLCLPWILSELLETFETTFSKLPRPALELPFLSVSSSWGDRSAPPGSSLLFTLIRSGLARTRGSHGSPSWQAWPPHEYYFTYIYKQQCKLGLNRSLNRITWYKSKVSNINSFSFSKAEFKKNFCLRQGLTCDVDPAELRLTPTCLWLLP